MQYVNTASGDGRPAWRRLTPPRRRCRFRRRRRCCSLGSTGAPIRAPARDRANAPAPHAAWLPGATTTRDLQANAVGFQVPGASSYARSPRIASGRHHRPRAPTPATTRSPTSRRRCRRPAPGTYSGRERPGRHRRRPLRGLDAGGRLRGSDAAAAQPDRRRRFHHGLVGVAADHDPGIRVHDAAYGTRADDVGLRRLRGRRGADRRQRDRSNTTKLSDPGQPGEQLLRQLDHEPGDERHHAESQRLNNWAYDSSWSTRTGSCPTTRPRPTSS